MGRKSTRYCGFLEIWKGYIAAGNAPFVSGCTLVRYLGKEEVAGSSPANRFNRKNHCSKWFFIFYLKNFFSFPDLNESL